VDSPDVKAILLADVHDVFTSVVMAQGDVALASWA
jgi:hypothetical protein